MKRLLLLASLSLSALANSAFAVPIVGFNDPENNRAEVTSAANAITILNQSNYQGTITAFGFDAMNDAFGLVSVTGTRNDGSWDFVTNSRVGGGGGGSFEFGVTTANSGNLIGGSPNDGIAPTQAATFTFDSPSGLGELSNYFVRFQRTGANGEGSDRGVECTSDCGPPPPVDVSEPSILFLLGAGLLGVGVSRRRKA